MRHRIAGPESSRKRSILRRSSTGGFLAMVGTEAKATTAGWTTQPLYDWLLRIPPDRNSSFAGITRMLAGPSFPLARTAFPWDRCGWKAMDPLLWSFRWLRI